MRGAGSGGAAGPVPTGPVLEVRDLRLEAPGGVALLRGVSLSLRPGVPLTILGETGSGKTLVVEAIMGTLAPALRAAGRIAVDGTWAEAGERDARRHLWGRRLAMLPQEPWLALDPTMRALPQVAESHALVRGAPGTARLDAASDLSALGLAADAGRRFPHQLSGGMAQRVALAAARAGGAGLLLADEPTKGLDADRRGAVVAALRAALEGGGALLCITHDVAVARALGGELAVMLEGEVVERGPAERVLSAPAHPYTRRLLAAEPSAWPDPARAAPGEPVIEASDLSVSAGGRELFSGLDLRLGAGEWVSVTGPSGCGKSTLGNALLGLRRPDRGRVRRTPGISATRFGKLYQDPVATFAPRRTLRAALAEVAALHRAPWERALALLDRLRVADALLDRPPDAVSGGELQRVAMVRALLPDPVFLFADEPTSRLDPITQQDTLRALGDAAAARNCAVLLVTHDHALAAKVAARNISLGSARLAA